jgi:acyl-CoA hydrolase
MNEDILKPKSPGQSSIETRFILMPQDTNQYGTAFGGVITSWIDMVAGMAAQRHCQREVVTASIDRITFEAPAYIGEHLVMKAGVNYVGNTSMEVGVQVTKENPVTGESRLTTTAYLTFVALDENKKPVKVAPLMIVTDEEKRRNENAQIRVQARKELFQKLNKEK